MRPVLLAGFALLAGCVETSEAERSSAALEEEAALAAAAAGSDNQFGLTCDVQDSEAMGGERSTSRYSIDLDRMLWCVPETTCGRRPVALVAVSEAEITLFDDGDIKMDLERVSGIYTLTSRSHPELHATGNCEREPYTDVGDRQF